MKAAVGALLAAALAFGAVTLYALEGHEVVVLRTHAPGGSMRETRTWVADDGGAIWIEAASPERPFLQHLLANPEVEVERNGAVRRYRAVPLPNPAGHLRIRALLAEKYGWADWWVGLLTDTSASVAVRLEPIGDPGQVPSNRLSNRCSSVFICG
jgi:hypothetical protein